VLAGAVLYAGMYAQTSPAVMYAAIGVGYAAWAALYLWVRSPPVSRPPRRTARAMNRLGDAPGFSGGDV